MGTIRNRPTTADLFSAPAARAASPPPLASTATNPAKTQRHILPNNLPAAVKHLDDGELERLLSVVIAEQERRGTKKPVSDQNARKRQVRSVAAPLTLGKINAIRAALKAGITPSRIAREFGLSQSDVRKVLAEAR